VYLYVYTYIHDKYINMRLNQWELGPEMSGRICRVHTRSALGVPICIHIYIHYIYIHIYDMYVYVFQSLGAGPRTEWANSWSIHTKRFGCTHIYIYTYIIYISILMMYMYMYFSQWELAHELSWRIRRVYTRSAVGVSICIYIHTLYIYSYIWYICICISVTGSWATN